MVVGRFGSGLRMTNVALDIQRIDQSLERSLAALFREINASGDRLLFHPHTFDDQAARWIANYAGKDLYFGARRVGEERLAGYGMLRGWDAGYDMPSLGILIAEGARGEGLGKTLMLFLHEAARARGCTRIRLKVHPSNIVAVRLYEKLGYRFEGEEDGQLVGIVEL